MLTSAQLLTFKNHINANTTQINGVPINEMPNNADANFAIAAFYSSVASPDFWVWRTAVSRSEIYNNASPTASNWSWTTYKNQGATEQNAWVQMFMGDQADFSKQNLRDGIGAIFTGSAQANAQRDHCLAMGRRLAKRIEQLLATGTGSSASPATMGYEGNVSGDDVQAARNS